MQRTDDVNGLLALNILKTIGQRTDTIKKYPPTIQYFHTYFFLLKIASIMAETNFTLGPTSKTNKIPVLMVIICPELDGFK